MAYRDDLTALAARHDALAGEVVQKTRELEESRRMLEQARARAKLPVLDNIHVATPCTADWNRMKGDDRTRHCGECKKNVYNLSGMTREEAEALLIERSGDLCVRYYQRHDGTIVLADCTIGVSRGNRHKWIAAGAATLLAGGIGAAAAHHMLALERVVDQRPVQHMMGALAPPPRLTQPPARPRVQVPKPPGEAGEAGEIDAPVKPTTMRLPPERE